MFIKRPSSSKKEISELMLGVSGVLRIGTSAPLDQTKSNYKKAGSLNGFSKFWEIVKIIGSNFSLGDFFDALLKNRTRSSVTVYPLANCILRNPNHHRELLLRQISFYQVIF